MQRTRLLAPSTFPTSETGPQYQWLVWPGVCKECRCLWMITRVSCEADTISYEASTMGDEEMLGEDVTGMNTASSSPKHKV